MNIKSQKFKSELINRTGQKDILKRIHYFSYLNVKKGLNETYNSELNQKLISKLIEYENIILNLEKPIDKITSQTLYKEYIYPAGYHLERKQRYNYVSLYDLHIKIIIGIILDLIIWYFLSFGIYIPIFTVSLYYKGITKRKKAKKEKKYFGTNY